jgi:hypothetical protein
MEKSYIQLMAERTDKAAHENDIEELKKIYQELITSDNVELKNPMGIEFFYSSLTSEQLQQVTESDSK